MALAKPSSVHTAQASQYMQRKQAPQKGLTYSSLPSVMCVYVCVYVCVCLSCLCMVVSVCVLVYIHTFLLTCAV